MKPGRQILVCLSACAAMALTVIGPAAADTGAGGNGSPGLVGPAVSVGVDGNEPNILVAPDGTLYISALEFLYLSRDGGRTWFKSPGTIYSNPANQQQGVNLNTDSTISLDPSGRLYFAFDYPYAGTTAVCTSTDYAQHFTCDQAAVPGGTDRMWISTPDAGHAYLTDNEGLYQTILWTSTDHAASWSPNGSTTDALEPDIGALVPAPGGKVLYQPYVANASNQSATDNELSGPMMLHVWATSAAAPATSADLPVGTLAAGAALPSAAVTPDGDLYVASEGVSGTDAAGNPTGKDVEVARSADGGKHWTVLPALPGTATGTAAFTAVAAGADGTFGVLYYYTPAGGRADSVNGVWEVRWSVTHDAEDPAPSWTTQVVDTDVHTGAMCTTAGCTGTNRFAGDFISATFDRSGGAHLAWVKELPDASTVIRYAGPATAPDGSVPELGLPAGAAAAGLLIIGGLAGRRRRSAGEVS